MGGGNVGNVRIGVDIDVSEAATAINKLRGQLSALERAKFAPGTGAAAAANKEIDKLNRGISALGGTVDKNTNFINRHATAINQLAFSAARAGGGFANFLPLVARVTTLLAKHEFGEGGINGALSALKEKFGSAGTAAQAFVGSGGRASGALSALTGVASKAATALEGVGVVAIGVAAGVLALVAAVGFLAVKLGPLGAEFSRLENLMKIGFGEAGEEAVAFSEKTSESLGLTQKSILEFMGRLGDLFRASGSSREGAIQLSEGLLIATDIFRRASKSAIDMAGAMDAVRSTISGNIEGLRNLDVFITEIDLRQRAAALGIDIATGALDAQTRQYLSTLVIIDKARQKLQDYGDVQESLPEKLTRAKSAFTDIKTVIGQALAPALIFVIDLFAGWFSAVKEGYDNIRNAIKTSESLTTVLKYLASVAVAPLKIGFALLGGAIKAMSVIISATIKVIDFLLKPVKFLVDQINKLVGAVERAAKILHLLPDEQEEAAKKAKELAEAEIEAANAAKAAADEFRNSAEGLKQQADVLERVIDAREKLARAIEDGAKRIAEAEEAQRRAVEDSQQAIEDAQRDLQKARRTRIKAIEDASDKVKEVERNNARAIIDAQDALEDAQEDRRRSIRNAEEKLRDLRLDSARRVDAAEKALADARQKRQDDILNATLSLEEALLAGDAMAERRARLELSRAARTDSLREAEKKLRETRLDTTEAIAKAERDLAETILDANEKVREAEEKLRRVREDASIAANKAARDLADTILEQDERVAESKRKLDKVYQEAERRIIDAVNNRIDAETDAARAIKDARSEVNRLDAEFGTVNTTVDELNTKLDATLAKLREINSLKPFPGGGGGDSRDDGGGASGGFAHGGRYPANRWRVVGEKGPELDIPDRSGFVVNNVILRQLIDAMKNGGKGVSGDTTVIVNEAIDAHATTDAVLLRLGQATNN